MEDKLIIKLVEESKTDIDIKTLLERNHQLNEKLKHQRKDWMRNFYDDLTDLECKYINEAFELGFDLSLVIHGKEPYFKSNK